MSIFKELLKQYNELLVQDNSKTDIARNEHEKQKINTKDNKDKDTPIRKDWI